MKHPFRTLTPFERTLWITSLIVVSASFILSPDRDILSLIASLIGVTALLFVAKGYVLGQILTVVFAVFYGILSYPQAYYGEMLTYLGMTAPMAILAAISWFLHPYRDTMEVTVSRLSHRKILWLLALTTLTTIGFYFLLRALGTADLPLSTLSVTTSFLASALTFLRSPYYALGYAANDVVLILLWILASARDISSLPMVFCFVMFLANDLYGFVNWRRMQRKQFGNKSGFSM